MKLATVNSGILYSRSFAKLDSITTTAAPTTERLAEQQSDRHQHDAEVAAGRHAPRGHEHVHQDREQQQLLDARAPAQEREPGPGVLGDAALLDLPELERAAVVLHRDAARSRSARA